MNTPITTAQSDTAEATLTCTACGEEVAEDLAVLLSCCDTEWVCPGCDDGREQTCESCWQSEQRSMVGGIY